jgi:UDP-glucuronate 4-epimerase
MSERILVTGSAGFIGFAVARELLQQGCSVVGLDNYNDYYSPVLKQARAAVLQEHDGYTDVEMDVCNLAGLRDLFSQYRFNHVCHLAAQAGVRYSLEHPFVYEHSNLAGFLNILEMCRHYTVPHLVYASSSSVYGGNTKIPFAESDPVDSPISLYAATKKANELMAHCYSHLYNIQTIGLRFFTVYGPWGRPDMAVWLFTEAISQDKPINVFNHGNMRRDFTFIDDIVDGVIAALFTEGLEQYELFNLGNHRSENLLDMIDVIETALGKKARLELLPIQPGDVPETYADIDRAREKLKYDPVTTIREGIPRFVDWYTEWSKQV